MILVEYRKSTVENLSKSYKYNNVHQNQPKYLIYTGLIYLQQGGYKSQSLDVFHMNVVLHLIAAIQKYKFYGPCYTLKISNLRHFLWFMYIL